MNVTTTPIQLTPETTEILLDDKDRYTIKIAKGDYLVVTMGFKVDKAGAKFTHPNIALTNKTIHHFKHYRGRGGKFWTSHAGINHTFVIPKDKITILPEKGYSYIKAIINGVYVTFNVSGGTNNGWTDYLNENTHTSVNHKLSDLKKIAEIAVRNSPIEPLKTTPLDNSEEMEWNKLQARSNKTLKNTIYKMIDEKKKPIICLNSGLQFNGYHSGKGMEVRRQNKRVVTPDGNGIVFEPIGAVKTVVVSASGSQYNLVRLTNRQIDWEKTAKENGLA